MTANALPDLDRLDKGALKALAIELQGELRQQRETLAQQEAELAALEAEFAVQRLQLAEQGGDPPLTQRVSREAGLTSKASKGPSSR
ncbi:MAG: hypothetical protein WCA21_20065 [Terracidiphilus sp.]